MKSVLYVSAECLPFSGKSSLAEVTHSLPKRLSAYFDMRVITPMYLGIGLAYFSRMKCMGSLTVSLSWRTHKCKLFSLVQDNVIYYFIQNDYYFGRDNLFGYYDDEERFAFFSSAVVKSLELIDFSPDIVHSNDWQSALVPVFMRIRNRYSLEQGNMFPKQIFTIQHIARQGKCDVDMIEDLLGISKNQLCILENGGKINFMKGAIVVCDRFNTVSKNYAAELRSSTFALGLESIININSGKFSGILHGIDYENYNPETDGFLYCNYTLDNYKQKLQNKLLMQKQLCLAQSEDIPMIIMISKLVSNKGMDIVKEAIYELLKTDVQFVMLGEGEERYESFFANLERAYPTKTRCMVMHNEEFAHRLFAAGDFMVLPSQVEPCGRSQMIALRYGTVPVARRIGGLADSIEDVTKGGNGYVFDEYSSSALLNALQRATTDYKDRESRKSLVKRSMAADFSWSIAAMDYKKLYDEV